MKGAQSTRLSVNNSKKNSNSCQPIRECVLNAIARYFSNLEGNETTNLHSMVIAEVESALLESVMQQVSQNQTKAAVLLGISRGTLRKKLAQYGLD